MILKSDHNIAVNILKCISYKYITYEKLKITTILGYIRLYIIVIYSNLEEKIPIFEISCE